MTTYSIRELRAKAGQILDSLAEGEEVIITRRGKPCGKLFPRKFRGVFPTAKVRHLPDLSLEEIQGFVKGLWHVEDIIEVQSGDDVGSPHVVDTSSVVAPHRPVPYPQPREAAPKYKRVAIVPQL